MAKTKSKRYQEAAKLVDANKVYTLKEAIGVLKQFPAAKFNQSVDLSFYLNIDPKKSDQLIRGTVSLPHGTGKSLER